MLSELTAAVMGRGIFYYVTIGSILLVLSLSANTAFADFPRLTRAIALNKYLPGVFIIRGRRLLYSHGIYALTTFTAILLIIFRGVTDRLIPLYAIGAFLAFTLSQAGMVMHWRRVGGKGAVPHILINGLGAFATGVTVLVVLVAKFVEGAWITAVMIPLLIFLMLRVKRHYNRMAAEVNTESHSVWTISVGPSCSSPWSAGAASRKRVCASPSCSRRTSAPSTSTLATIRTSKTRKTSSRLSGSTWLSSRSRPQSFPYPKLINPALTISLHRSAAGRLHAEGGGGEPAPPDRRHGAGARRQQWWQNLLHNQRAQVLKLLILVKGSQRVLVIDIPWI